MFEIGGVLGTAMLGFFVTRYFFTVFSQYVLKEHVTQGTEKVSFILSQLYCSYSRMYWLESHFDCPELIKAKKSLKALGVLLLR